MLPALHGVHCALYGAYCTQHHLVQFTMYHLVHCTWYTAPFSALYNATFSALHCTMYNTCSMYSIYRPYCVCSVDHWCRHHKLQFPKFPQSYQVHADTFHCRNRVSTSLWHIVKCVATIYSAHKSYVQWPLYQPFRVHNSCIKYTVCTRPVLCCVDSSSPTEYSLLVLCSRMFCVAFVKIFSVVYCRCTTLCTSHGFFSPRKLRCCLVQCSAVQ